jgi:hypothetical protein
MNNFAFVNTVFQSNVEIGNDVRTEQQIIDALCHNGGLMGSTAVHVDGARSGVDEAAENSKSKKKVCVLSKAFKSRNTGVRETHKIQWKKGDGTDV